MDDGPLPRDLMNIVSEYAAERDDQEWCDIVFALSPSGLSFDDRERHVLSRHYWSFNDGCSKHSRYHTRESPCLFVRPITTFAQPAAPDFSRHASDVAFLGRIRALAVNCRYGR